MASQMASCNSGCRIGHDVQYLDFLFLQKPITSWVLASKAELKKKKKKHRRYNFLQVCYFCSSPWAFWQVTVVVYSKVIIIQNKRTGK